MSNLIAQEDYHLSEWATVPDAHIRLLLHGRTPSHFDSRDQLESSGLFTAASADIAAGIETGL
jgi:hypothetical protein